MTFSLDGMLTGLCTLMRIMGFDTYLRREKEKTKDFLNRSLREGRIIITVSKRIQGKDILHLETPTSSPQSQMMEVIGCLSLTPRKDYFLSRCLLCNSPFLDVSAQEVADKIQKNIFDRYDIFHLCPECHKVYWAGSHTNELWQKVKKILPGGKCFLKFLKPGDNLWGGQ